MRTIGNTPVDGEVRAVASGTLPSGQPVVVNADGTVSVIEETSLSQTLGTPVVFDTGDAFEIGICFDSTNNKVVIVYRDGNNSNYGTAIVGTVSGTSISFGTPVVYNSATTTQNTAVFDSSNAKVVVGYTDNGNSSYGTSIVGTVSGTSISFGSEVVFSSSNTQYIDSIYDSGNEKIIFSYSNAGSSYSITSIVGTVSGTSISFGTAADTGQDGYYTGNVYDPDTGKFVVGYVNSSSSDGQVFVGTVSGTSISYGSAVTFQASAVAENLAMVYDTSNNKVIIAYDNSANNVGSAIVGTISGTSISFGSFVSFETGGRPGYPAMAYDETAQKIGIFYEDKANSEYGTYIAGTVSGTSITFDTAVVYQTGTTSWQAAVYDSNEKKLVGAYQDQNNGGKAVVVQNSGAVTNLTSENYIGMSQGVVVSSVLGTKSVYESASSPFTSIVYDSNSNKIVVAYRDNGNSQKGTAVVGTVNGSSITFGTPVVFDTSESVSSDISAVFDSTNNKIVIAWKAGAQAGKAVVGTVSGTSISFGSVAQFDSSSVNDIAVAFDSSNEKTLICYKKLDTGKAVVGTVSGTSISFGSIVNFESGEAVNMSAAFDSSSNKIVIGYADAGNGTYGTAVVGTISGTSVSFGTPVVFETAVCGPTSTVFDPLNNKIVITYSGDSTYGKSIVGTVSGTSISFGSATTFQALAINYLASAFDSTKGQVVCLYNDTSGSPYNTLSKSGTVSGTSISFGSESIVTAEAYNFKVTHDPDNGINIAAFQDSGNSYYGTAVAFNNEERGQVADGDSAVINSTCTVDSNQSGLTAGQKYYVQVDGTLGLTPATPSVLAGTAVSATKLIVKG